ncbi:MAG: DsbA family protein [Myxococcales bacterium]
MRSRNKLWPTLLVALCPLVLVAATCKGEQPAQQTAPATAPAASKEAKPKVDGAPRVDFAKHKLTDLTETAREQVQQVASDEFCYCGCPHLLAGCLEGHTECRHAPRMLMLTAALAQMGARSSEIIGELQRYYGSFKKEKRAQFDLTETACTGPADAPVTVVEFSDFECPHCAAARPMLEGFVQAAKGKVRLCFKHFPLQSHPNALKAAQAAEFARAHGKFWEFHDLVFENQLTMSMEDLKSHAREVGLDPAAMEKAVLAETYLARVQSMKDEGRKAGIEATPSVFLNGRPLILPLSPGALVHAVEDELEYMQHGRWAQD